MINAVWTWLRSLPWTTIVIWTVVLVVVVCCVVGAWLTLVRNARRASE